jgi:hypothetical protein
MSPTWARPHRRPRLQPRVAAVGRPRGSQAADGARWAYVGAWYCISCGTPTHFGLAHDAVPLNVIQRQLDYRYLGVTSIHLQGIDPNEIIETVHARRQPMTPASAALVLPIGR